MKKFTTIDTLNHFFWWLGFPPIFCAGIGYICNGHPNSLIVGFIFLIMAFILPNGSRIPEYKLTQIILDETNKTITIITVLSSSICNSRSTRIVSFDDIYNIEYTGAQQIMPLLYLEHFNMILYNGSCINGIPLLKTEIIYILKKYIPHITPGIINRCKLDDYIMNVLAFIWVLTSIVLFFIVKNM